MPINENKLNTGNNLSNLTLNLTPKNTFNTEIIKPKYILMGILNLTPTSPAAIRGMVFAVLFLRKTHDAYSSQSASFC